MQPGRKRERNFFQFSRLFRLLSGCSRFGGIKVKQETKYKSDKVNLLFSAAKIKFQILELEFYFLKKEER